MHKDNPPLGIALMLGFCLFAPAADAAAKILGAHLSVLQITFLRFAVQAVVLVPLVAATGRVWRMSARVAWLVAARTALHIAGIGCMVSALIHLPLADAVAIAFVMPFIMLLLGHVALGEEVGWRRLAACAVGFAGTLMVLQPAFAEVGAPALLPLAVAVIFALFMLVTRMISRETDPVAMQAVSACMALPVLTGALMLAPAVMPAAAWQPAGAGTWALMLLMGLLGTAGHLLMTWSLRFAPAATLAPMQYLEIPIATLYGFVIFGDLPGPLAAAGIGVILAAGLYVVMRERAMLRGSAPAPGAVPKDTTPAG